MVTKEQILKDNRFKIDTQDPDRLFQIGIKKVEVVEVKLKDLRCYYGEKVLFLDETSIYQYLDDTIDGKDKYEIYCKKYPSSFRNKDNYESLIQEMNSFEYDIKKGAIVTNQLGIIIDGQHRCSILLKKYGEEHIIKVVKIHYHKLLLGLRLLLFKRKIADMFLKIGGGVLGKKLFEKILASYCFRFQGGECHSSLLRRYYKIKYHVDADYYSYGCFTPKFNFGGNSVKVGRYCSIAEDVRFFGANHPLDNFSTSPLFYNQELGYEVKDIERHRLIVSDDVWIGYGVRITCGCKHIGRGSVIGAGSVVTKDVPPYSVVVGIPAKVIKKRFTDKDRELMKESYWWMLSPEELITIHNASDNLNDFSKTCFSKL